MTLFIVLCTIKLTKQENNKKTDIISLFILIQTSIGKISVCRIDEKFASFLFIAYIYYKILVDLTLIRQGDVIHVLTRKKWFWMTIIWCVYCNLYEKL